MKSKVFLTLSLWLGFLSAPWPAMAQGGVLVFGGTGALGAEVVKALVARGDTVTVFARPTSDKKRLAGLNVAYATGDLRKRDDVVAAVTPGAFRAIVDTSANRDRRSPLFYEEAMVNIVAGAKAGGVKHIIIHSSIGVAESEAVFVGPKATFPVADFDRMRPNITDKAKAETVVAESGISYTIIRNGLIDFEGAALTGTAILTEDRMAFGRVTRPDLAWLTAACLDNPACMNKTYHAVDPSLAGPRPERGR